MRECDGGETSRGSVMVRVQTRTHSELLVDVEVLVDVKMPYTHTRMSNAKHTVDTDTKKRQKQRRVYAGKNTITINHALTGCRHRQNKYKKTKCTQTWTYVRALGVQAHTQSHTHTPRHRHQLKNKLMNQQNTKPNEQ